MELCCLKKLDESGQSGYWWHVILFFSSQFNIYFWNGFRGAKMHQIWFQIRERETRNKSFLFHRNCTAIGFKQDSSGKLCGIFYFPTQAWSSNSCILTIEHLSYSLYSKNEMFCIGHFFARIFKIGYFCAEIISVGCSGIFIVGNVCAEIFSVGIFTFTRELLAFQRLQYPPKRWTFLCWNI